MTRTTLLKSYCYRGKFHPVGVCCRGSTCLDCMLPGVQVTAGLGFFLCSSCLSDSENSDSLLYPAV